MSRTHAEEEEAFKENINNLKQDCLTHGLKAALPRSGDEGGSKGRRTCKAPLTVSHRNNMVIPGGKSFTRLALICCCYSLPVVWVGGWVGWGGGTSIVLSLTLTICILTLSMKSMSAHYR